LLANRIRSDKGFEQVNKIFDGKAAIITGGGHGIGKAIAEAYSSFGAKVVINARNKSELEAVAAKINQNGGQAVAVAGDIGDAVTAPLLLKACVDAFGTCDILVNNAAINGQTDYVEDLDLAKWNEVFRINMTGTMLMCRAAMPQMKKQRSGRIINVSSALAIRVQRGRSPYSATKAAVIQYTKVLAEEVKPYGIAANAVRPGLVATPMTAAQIDQKGSPAQEETGRRIGEQWRAGTMLTPEQSARFFVWMAGGCDRTGEYIQIEDTTTETDALYQRIGG
jgi:3-oxoacyl-[acyl-carrier protein] reductase